MDFFITLMTIDILANIPSISTFMPKLKHFRDGQQMTCAITKRKYEKYCIIN